MELIASSITLARSSRRMSSLTARHDAAYVKKVQDKLVLRAFVPRFPMRAEHFRDSSFPIKCGHGRHACAWIRCQR
jgi:hypothetical protein